MQSDVNVNSFDKLSPSACNLTCEEYTDVVYLGDCGGENAYNLFEFKEGTFCLFDLYYYYNTNQTNKK